MLKRVVVFDLDKTVINSDHRTPTLPDGTIDLPNYWAKQTREHIMRDTLLPLYRVFRTIDRQSSYVVIATARAMTDADFDFLHVHQMHYDKIVHRGSPRNAMRDHLLKEQGLQFLQSDPFNRLPVYMFDDAPSVIKHMRSLNIVTLNSIKINKRIAK